MSRHMVEDDEEDLGALYDQTGNVRDDERPVIGHNGGPPLDDPDPALDGMSLEDMLRESRKDLLKSLLKAVRGGYATPAQENTLRQLLKDNGMVLGDPGDGARSDDEKTRPAAPLPTFQRPEYE